MKELNNVQVDYFINHYDNSGNTRSQFRKVFRLPFIPVGGIFIKATAEHLPVYLKNVTYNIAHDLFSTTDHATFTLDNVNAYTEGGFTAPQFKEKLIKEGWSLIEEVRQEDVTPL